MCNPFPPIPIGVALSGNERYMQRDDQIDDLDKKLEECLRDQNSGLVNVVGLPLTGKTLLIDQWREKRAGEGSDTIVYISFDDFFMSRSNYCEKYLTIFRDALPVSASELPFAKDEPCYKMEQLFREQWRRRFAKQHLFIVLDQFQEVVSALESKKVGVDFLDMLFAPLMEMGAVQQPSDGRLIYIVLDWEPLAKRKDESYWPSSIKDHVYFSNISVWHIPLLLPTQVESFLQIPEGGLKWLYSQPDMVSKWTAGHPAFVAWAGWLAYDHKQDEQDWSVFDPDKLDPYVRFYLADYCKALRITEEERSAMEVIARIFYEKCCDQPDEGIPVLALRGRVEDQLINQLLVKKVLRKVRKMDGPPHLYFFFPLIERALWMEQHSN